MATRINKYLSEVGYCSRRRADRLIEEGKVTINGEVTEIGSKVEDNDEVEVEGQRIKKSKLIGMLRSKNLGLYNDHEVERNHQYKEGLRIIPPVKVIWTTLY